MRKMERCPDCGFIMKGKTCLHCKLEDYDNSVYVKFTNKALKEKALNTLIGILKGISYDGDFTEKELDNLYSWYTRNYELNKKENFQELFVTIENILLNNSLSANQCDDLIWLTNNLLGNNKYFDTATSDMQELQGILEGIISDNIIEKCELLGLSNWLDAHENLQSFYPYDEIYSLIMKVLEDGVVDKNEEAYLKAYFAQFTHIASNTLLSLDKVEFLQDKFTTSGICATDPIIDFTNKNFTFTGKSSKATRVDFANIIEEHNGFFMDSLTKKTNYLIVGADGNKCWAFNCYGRKIEKAIQMRKDGIKIILVNELDFWDAIY